ncbi:MAG: holo-ACP synthase [Planctomycetota bacterium]
MKVVKAVGTDLVEVARIARALERYQERFKDRLFSDEERTYCDAKKTPAVHYAGRFAAKEAVIKVLGAGFTAGIALTAGGSFREVVVERQSSGQPLIRLEGQLAAMAVERGISEIMISITHTHQQAMAFAIGQGPA